MESQLLVSSNYLQPSCLWLVGRRKKCLRFFMHVRLFQHTGIVLEPDSRPNTLLVIDTRFKLAISTPHHIFWTELAVAVIYLRKYDIRLYYQYCIIFHIILITYLITHPYCQVKHSHSQFLVSDFSYCKHMYLYYYCYFFNT